MGSRPACMSASACPLVRQMGCSYSLPRDDLLEAIRNDDKWLLRNTLRNSPGAVNDVYPKTGRSVLSIAAHLKKVYMVKELLAHGASVHTADAKVS